MVSHAFFNARSFIFHPRKATQNASNQDILFNIDKNIYVGVRFHLKNKIFPTILFFHGNGEIVTDYDDIALIFNNKKINFIIADYRGYGFSNGIPNIKNTLKDSHLILYNVKKILKYKQYNNNLI